MWGHLQQHVPSSLVDGEDGLAVLPRISVASSDDPRRRIRDPEVEDLAGLDDRVQGVHDFGDGGRPVPPVEVEDVDVLGPQLLERVAEGEMERLLAVAGVVDRRVLAVRVGAVGGLWEPKEN